MMFRRAEWQKPPTKPKKKKKTKPSLDSIVESVVKKEEN
jgi:hypothetical protein